MRHGDKHELEGLLKARAEDMGRRTRPRAPARLGDAAPSPPRTTLADEPPPSSRACSDCSAEIDPRRRRAMPSAARCLDCQRAFELAHQPA